MEKPTKRGNSGKTLTSTLTKSKPEMGLQSLGQGSRIRAQNGEGQAGSRCGVLKMETNVCGGTGYVVGDFRMSLSCGDVWIRVLVRCYMECNRNTT